MTRFRATGLRLALALGLGFALWLFVSYTQNPDRTTSLGSIQVMADNLGPSLVLVDTSTGAQITTLPVVELTVEGDQATTSKVLLSDFRAFVDLQGLGVGEHKVPVGVVPNRSNLNQITTITSPDDLSVRIDQAITRTVPLTIEVSGQVPFSYERGTPSVLVEGKPVQEVEVRGPQNQVGRVVSVRTSANVDRLTANYESSRPLEALDASNSVVEGVSVVPASARVQVPIDSSVGLKRIPIIPRTVGQPAEGYVVTGVSVDPQFVDVTGGSGALDEFNQIDTTNVDVSGATGPISKTVPLQSPPLNTSIQSTRSVSATVNVTIAPIDRVFRVKLPVAVTTTNAPSGYRVSLDQSFVDVTLSGSATRLADLDASSLQATVSLRGLRAGQHTLAVNITVPDGITVEGTPPNVTVTLVAPATPVPTAQPTAVPTAAPAATVPPATAPAATAEPAATAPPAATEEPAAPPTAEPAAPPATPTP